LCLVFERFDYNFSSRQKSRHCCDSITKSAETHTRRAALIPELVGSLRGNISSLVTEQLLL